MSSKTIKEIITEARVIAIVGLSANPEKESNEVARYLLWQGYHIIPVNPNVDQVFGEQAYPDLLSVPEKVDIVNIFRPSQDVLPIVEQAIKTNATTVWMQLGIRNEEAAELARQAGLHVVMDRCLMIDHRELVSREGNEL